MIKQKVAREKCVSVLTGANVLTETIASLNTNAVFVVNLVMELIIVEEVAVETEMTEIGREISGTNTKEGEKVKRIGKGTRHKQLQEIVSK